MTDTTKSNLPIETRMTSSDLQIETLGPSELTGSPEWLHQAPCLATTEPAFVESPRWLPVLREGLAHQVYCVRAIAAGQIVGLLPLAFVKSLLFGRFLVSLPYVNSAGVIAENDEVMQRLIDAAVALADKLDVRYLELRQEREITHAALTQTNHSKFVMRMNLPATVDELWNGFKSKLRSQVKSGQKNDFEILWGGLDKLDAFYEIFCRNMRDLGTPVFPRHLFAAILREFEHEAEFCVLRLQGRPVASALLMHGRGMTEVPSASSLREFNATNANMVMYWHLLRRAVERRQKVFDFGRSTLDGNTFKFKQQWGALPHPSVWQYYVRHGSMGDMRPSNSKFSLAIKVWQQLPVAVTRVIGPLIVRGIP